MITAVDTSVLLDVFLPDARHGPQSVQRLRDAYDRGAILVCDVVYAELVPAFDDRTALDGVLREIGGTPSPVDTAMAYEAGVRWRRYRQAGDSRWTVTAARRYSSTGCRQPIPGARPAGEDQRVAAFDERWLARPERREVAGKWT